MRYLLFAVAMTACGDNGSISPDAPLPSVHDQLNEECGLSWGDGVSNCEHACVVMPVVSPCHGAAPCLDQKACAYADNGRPFGNGLLRVDCPATFIVSDWTGDHRGCCVVRDVPLQPEPLHIPSFYECP